MNIVIFCKAAFRVNGSDTIPTHDIEHSLQHANWCDMSLATAQSLSLCQLMRTEYSPPLACAVELMACSKRLLVSDHSHSLLAPFHDLLAPLVHRPVLTCMLCVVQVQWS